MRGSTSQLLTRLSRDTLVFSAASLLTVVLAFWTVRAVTTHLTPSEYGQLAIYYFFASLLTILYNLVLLPGTLLRVFGASGEEDVDDDQRLRAPISGKRVALTTGLLATIGVILTGTLVVYVAAEPLVSLLFDSGGNRRILAIAATSAGLGAIWRLVSNVSRFET
ncbi:MAG: hypothetical protein QOE28_407, partial [Solirubrobacteraceae bacterium]|nr:hypothetical protein [Solirubrobacteraceae bacterium]